mmetsp:Transcript_6143/g.24773  ORF Transcript_6143/g.24773 Transcript_6143/m.24773 type:complete len:461 (+) Transcript_6143:20-1402(+)
MGGDMEGKKGKKDNKQVQRYGEALERALVLQNLKVEKAQVLAIATKLVKVLEEEEEEEKARPTMCHLFFELAILCSQRSRDAKANVGCVIVNAKTSQVLALGYNAEIKGMNSEEAEHDKADLMVHAEMNALLHASVNLSGLELLVFVTRTPCAACMKCLAQFNIKAIFQGRCLTSARYSPTWHVAKKKQIPILKFSNFFAKSTKKITIFDTVEGGDQQITLGRHERNASRPMISLSESCGNVPQSSKEKCEEEEEKSEKKEEEKSEKEEEEKSEEKWGGTWPAKGVPSPTTRYGFKATPFLVEVFKKFCSQFRVETCDKTKTCCVKTCVENCDKTCDKTCVKTCNEACFEAKRIDSEANRIHSEANRIHERIHSEELENYEGSDWCPLKFLMAVKKSKNPLIKTWLMKELEGKDSKDEDTFTMHVAIDIMEGEGWNLFAQKVGRADIHEDVNVSIPPTPS